MFLKLFPLDKSQLRKIYYSSNLKKIDFAHFLNWDTKSSCKQTEYLPYNSLIDSIDIIINSK